MNPRRLILIGAFVFVTACLVWLMTLPREPQWQGRTMSEWFEIGIQEETLSPQRIQGGHVLPSPGTAQLAFRGLGTNAVEYLLGKAGPQPKPKAPKLQTFLLKYQAWIPKPILLRFLAMRGPRDEQRTAAVLLASTATRHPEVGRMLMDMLQSAKAPTAQPAGYVSSIQATFQFAGSTTNIVPGEYLITTIIRGLVEGQFHHTNLAKAFLHCATLGNSQITEEVEQAWGKSSVRASLEQNVNAFVVALNTPNIHLQSAAAIALGLWLLDLEPIRGGSRSAPKTDPIRFTRYRELLERHQIPDDRLIEVIVGTVVSNPRSNAQTILSHLAPVDDRVVEEMVYRLSIASPGQISWIGISLSNLGLSAVPALPTLMTFRENAATNSIPAVSLTPPAMTLSPTTNPAPFLTAPYDPVRSIAKATSDARLILLNRAYASMNSMPKTASPKVRAAVAKATENWPQDLVRELVYRFSLDDSTAWSAMRELEKLGPTIVSAALPDLHAALKHPNDRVRAQAAATIAEAGPAAILALPELKTLAESEAPNVRETIEKAIQKIEAAVTP